MIAEKKYSVPSTKYSVKTLPQVTHIVAIQQGGAEAKQLSTE